MAEEVPPAHLLEKKEEIVTYRVRKHPQKKK